MVVVVVDGLGVCVSKLKVFFKHGNRIISSYFYLGGYDLFLPY